MPEGPPSIAIVGSVDGARAEELGLRAVEKSRQAAEILGSELARSGLRLVVYSGDPQFIEADVVRGYVGSGAAKPRSIEICRPREAEAQEFSELADHPALFVLKPDASTDWEVSFYRSLFSADGVLLIGGGRSTFTTGLIALAVELPVVAVACFGGHAAKVWHALDRTPNHASQDDIAAMATPWRDELAGPLVASFIGQRERRAKAAADTRAGVAGARRRVFAALVVGVVLFAAAVACIPLAYTWAPGTARSLALLVGAPILAAASGAIVRNAFEESREWLKTAALGIMVGGISALLFVAAQLLTTPDVLQSADARRLLFFVLPVGFIAGLTFDDVYRKLRGQDVTKTDALK